MLNIEYFIIKNSIITLCNIDYNIDNKSNSMTNV